jgi:hypothetical protein
MKSYVIAAALVVVATLGTLALPAATAQAQRKGGGVCTNAALSDSDKSACAAAMKSATTKDDRAKVRQTYTDKVNAAKPAASTTGK